MNKNKTAKVQLYPLYFNQTVVLTELENGETEYQTYTGKHAGPKKYSRYTVEQLVEELTTGYKPKAKLVK